MGLDSAFDPFGYSLSLAVPAITQASPHPAGVTVVMSPWGYLGYAVFFRARPVGADKQTRKSQTEARYLD